MLQLSPHCLLGYTCRCRQWHCKRGCVVNFWGTSNCCGNAGFWLQYVVSMNKIHFMICMGMVDNIFYLRSSCLCHGHVKHVTPKFIHVDALKSDPFTIGYLIAIHLDVSNDFEKFMPSSTPMGAHSENEVLINEMMSKRIHCQTYYVLSAIHRKKFMSNMMPQRAFYCRIGYWPKQCMKLQICKIKCPPPAWYLIWHYPVLVDICHAKHGTYKIHIRQCPHQLTHQKNCSPHHF